jgi:hypothetical protein
MPTLISIFARKSKGGKGGDDIIEESGFKCQLTFSVV